jgi:hypothetical protein
LRRVDPLRTYAHIEETDGEPARSNSPHLDIEMSTGCLGCDLSPDSRPERQPERDDRRHRQSDEDEQLASAEREAQAHCSVARLTRQGWVGHPHAMPSGAAGYGNRGLDASPRVAQMHKKKEPKNPGSVLLSHTASRAVPSAPKSLTSEFGMGSGVASSKSPPETFGVSKLSSWALSFALSHARLATRILGAMLSSYVFDVCLRDMDQAARPISTG